jgi:superfamily II helicase
MLHKKHLCGNEKLKKEMKVRANKITTRTLEKFVFKKVNIQKVCINTIILNERFFFLPKAHKMYSATEKTTWKQLLYYVKL